MEEDSSIKSWRDCATYPLPGWCDRHTTLFDVEGAKLSDIPIDMEVAVCSVSFDSTASSRVGARDGPSAIRKASHVYSNQFASRDIGIFRNMQTGQLHRVTPPKIFDFGDLHVFPTSPKRQVDATRAEIFHLASSGAKIITLGGEHTLTYPAFHGVFDAFRERSNNGRLGYIHIDNHFDFGTTSSLHGSLYHGSNSRRISEIAGVDPSAMAFVGVGDFTSASQYDQLLQSGISIEPMWQVREVGFQNALRRSIDRCLDHCDGLYVSIDIDVCDTAVTSGTGHVTVGGINTAEFLSIATILQDYPIIALDIMEVNPSLDWSNIASHLSARLLFEWLIMEKCEIANQ
ncbi:arginase family protein [Sinorhizobium medicae]